MNKDFQKIIILGIVSIVISSLALYSLRDIKFKNTKKLNQEIEQQQATINEYQNLLSEPINIVSENINENLNTTGSLKVMMPKFLSNSSFEDINENLKTKEINVYFEYIDKLSDYKNLIKSGLSSFDIYVLPSNRLKGLNLETINIGDNPKTYFHTVFNDVITINENKIIPYSLDPMVIISKNNIVVGQNREDIFSYTTLRTQDRSYAMPLIRGIGKNDIRLLERLDGPFENYFEILYQHLNQIKQENNVSELKNMLDIEKISLDYKYNFARFKQLYDTINKRDEHCKLFPAICLLSYNFGDIMFGFISNLDILDKYFSNNNNQFKLQTFSNSQKNYPVRGRVFVVAKDNQNINLANEFFTEYIRQGIKNNTGLRNNTLSAINNIYNIQKTQDKYSEIIQNENNFELIYENINLQEEFIKDSKNLDLLKGNYNPELYLRN